MPTARAHGTSPRIGATRAVAGAGVNSPQQLQKSPERLKSPQRLQTPPQRSPSRLLASFLQLSIRAYQIVLGPHLGGACRFHPSCSHYASEAVTRHGPLRGSVLASRRVLRCHPFGGQGFDPVP